ncbi:MAG TPA: leucyl aminopeptidase [Gemmatimonadales bacterium]|nr:leucyl aminopeptidase [Gemmatimonadales bacterium]
MPLTTALRHADLASTSAPLLLVAVPQGPLPGSLAPLDAAIDRALTRLYAAGEFTGKKDQVASVYPGGPVARVLLVGAGEAAKASTRTLRRAASVAGKRARLAGVTNAAYFLTPEGRGTVAEQEAVQATTEGLIYGAWHFDALKLPPEEKRPVLERVEILAGGPAADAGHRIGSAIGAAQSLTRGLQVLPGNTCTPSFLAAQAVELAARHNFGVTVLDRAAIEREGMGALLAVGKGSAEDPRFIALEYKGAPGAPVVLVGKGVTFDTGGISIKPADRMEDMKFDMSGAAAVLGAFEALGRLKPKVHVVGLVPSAENMPSGTAYKPGDVVRALSGKHIEVVNTDAEGRLLLADALHYARRYEPACVLDIATLTGAVVSSLGHTAAAVLGTDDALIDEVRRAGDRSGERVWPLPLWDEFRELIKSDIADVKNSGGRPAGTITAAWFLREFAEGYPWAHLDIAGTAYTQSEDAGAVKGPTGMGVRLFAEFVLARQG